MTKKRPRRVGLGMKPRQTPVNTAVSTELEVPVSEIEVSGTAAQEEAVKEAVVEGVEGNESGVPLESGGVQILDSEYAEVGEELQNTPIVAQKPDFEPLPAVPQEAFDMLEDLMKKSEEVSGADLQFTVRQIPGREFSNFGGPTKEQLARSIYEDGKTDPREFAGMETVRMVTAEEADKWKKTYAIGVDYGSGEDKGAAAIVRLGENGAADEVVEMLDLKPIGTLPNGDYRATVRIGEVYVEGCKQQAEADGISLEDWLTIHLSSYLENWWSSAGAK